MRGVQRGKHEELAEGWECDVDQGVAAADTARISERKRREQGGNSLRLGRSNQLQRCPSLCLRALTSRVPFTNTPNKEITTSSCLYKNKNYNKSLAITRTNITIQPQIRHVWGRRSSCGVDSHETNTHFFVHSLAVVKNAALSFFNCCAVQILISRSNHTPP
jgi:hypothetical protein